MIKYSIIVPVYNTEKYIEECLTSFQKQKFNDFEVIIIDDGSTDNSALYCKKIEKNDARFRYYYKDNGGVSSARNCGIDKANGKYLLFVDSDDYISDDFFETINKNIKNEEMLCFNFYDLYVNTKKVHNNNLINVNNIKDKILISNDIGGFLCNKVFLTKIIKKNNIKLNENIHFCEDLLFVSQYLDYCKKIEYCSKPLYYYRIRKSSVTNNFISQKNITILKSFEYLINKYNNKLYKEYYSNLYLYYYYLLRPFYKLDKIDKNLIETKNINLKLLLLKFFPKLYLKIKKIKSLRNIYE